MNFKPNVSYNLSKSQTHINQNMLDYKLICRGNTFQTPKEKMLQKPTESNETLEFVLKNNPYS